MMKGGGGTTWGREFATVCVSPRGFEDSKFWAAFRKISLGVSAISVKKTCFCSQCAVDRFGLVFWSILTRME